MAAAAGRAAAGHRSGCPLSNRFLVSPCGLGGVMGSALWVVAEFGAASPQVATLQNISILANWGRVVPDISNILIFPSPLMVASSKPTVLTQ